MKRVFILLPLTAAAISISIWIRGSAESKLGGNPPGKSESPAGQTAPPGSIQGIGFVEPITEVRKLVFKVNGVIARCGAELGRAYKNGDVLMELDHREQLAAMNVAEAEWKMARAERDKVFAGVNVHQIDAAVRKVERHKEQVRHLRKEHARFQALASRNSVTQSEYDKVFTEMNQRQTELQQAEANLRHLQQYVRDEDLRWREAKVCAARAKLDLAKQLYDDTFLLALPFDGTVLEVLKREGEASRQTDPEPVVLFGDPSRLRVRAEIDERFVAGLRPGQRAVIRGRGLGDREYPGRVILIKAIMGKKTVFSRSSTERKDLDVVQVMVEMQGAFRAPIGLEVEVRLESDERR